MTAPEHSPLPWRVADEMIVDAMGFCVVGTKFSEKSSHPLLVTAFNSYVPSVQNARLIVTAVNAYAELLAAAKEILRLHGEWGHPAWAHLEAAISHAEEPAS